MAKVLSVLVCEIVAELMGDAEADVRMVFARMGPLVEPGVKKQEIVWRLELQAAVKGAPEVCATGNDLPLLPNDRKRVNWRRPEPHHLGN
jgi:hypothetical protein